MSKDCTVVVELKIIVSGRPGHDFPATVNHTLHGLLKRRVNAHKAAGPCVVSGVEGLEQDMPVSIPDGGTIVMHWEKHDHDSELMGCPKL